MAHKIDALIIGAGQAGLAMSRCLSDAGICHVLIERGMVGERWRSERWNSLRLLTPNWMTRLPGYAYSGNDPDGFMRRNEVACFLEGYRQSINAPVIENTQIDEVKFDGEDYRVTTNRDVWSARSVIIATGACERSSVPDFASSLPHDIHQVAPERYRSPADLPDGGVLVVGASATGIQLADELQRTGRPVTIAAGRHVRLPRLYRGQDLMRWLDLCGFLGEARPPDANAHQFYHQPSFQLIGQTDQQSLDLPRLAQQGARIVGRVAGLSKAVLNIEPSLTRETNAAEERRRKILLRIDTFIRDQKICAPEDPLAWAAPDRINREISRLNLRAAGIRTIVWATGYRRSYPWLRVPVLDGFGEILNRGGVTAAPGLFIIGMPFMRRRSSTFIDGVGRDAEELTSSVADHLRCEIAKAA